MTIQYPERMISRCKHIVSLVALGCAAFLIAGCQTPSSKETWPPPTKASQAAMTPDQALAEFRAGNDRFVAGKSRHRDLPAEVRASAGGQYPFAVVLSCLDSRQSAELIFDQGIGDIFSARVAGNVMNDDILGSLEFACRITGAKLIVVVGHTHCGAIKGAVDHAKLGNLTGLLDKIQPAVQMVPPNVQPRNAKNLQFVDDVGEANVKLVVKQITEQSPILKEMVEKGEIKVVGGMSDLDTGKVKFYAEEKPKDSF